MEILIYFLLLVVGGFIGAAGLFLRVRSKAADGTDEILTISMELTKVQTLYEESEKKYEELLSQKNSLQEKYEKEREIHAGLDKEKQLLQEQHRALTKSQENFKVEFENLAQKILEEKTKSISTTSEKNILNIINPLQEKIFNFEKTVRENYHAGSIERNSLKEQINNLVKLNTDMTNTTESLTTALKGDNKLQGDWGEVKLERILEASGLRKGHEYFAQENFKDLKGQNNRPDITVKLPEEKNIVIDSKMSLTAYDKYLSAESEGEKQVQLKEMVKSIKNHYKDLASKSYDNLPGMNSPEFVFMFVPIEPAFLLAQQEDKDLAWDAWKLGVVIVTPSTLFAGLKTVASIWQMDRQNKNSAEIADEAAKMYDKFQGFLVDYSDIKKHFDRMKVSYNSSLNKLRDGQGSVFSKMDKLKELGASPKKKIDQDSLREISE